MAIGLSVGDKYYSIGGTDFFHSFFQPLVITLNLMVGEQNTHY